MNRLETIQTCNRLLLDDMPQYRQQAQAFPNDEPNQRRLLRSLMNVRAPGRLHAEYLRLQDALLSEERERKGVVHVADLPTVPHHDRIALWQGDITRLDADAIVNAANSQLLGCFCPCHGCIDNAIHSAAGSQLREECSRIMQAQGKEEPIGRAKLTAAYNLPAKHVLHTVGPIITGRVTREDRRLLASCYRSCLALAAQNGLHSVAFCCISTGEFHFPNAQAARIAVDTVTEFLDHDQTIGKVIFNVFKDEDAQIYADLLG